MEEAVALSPSTEDQKILLKRLEQEANTSINLCYQCGKCSAGCPAAFAMDYTPRQIIRLLQLEMMEEALRAGSIWICASCETCSSRCPRGVNIAGIMDALRRAALRRGYPVDKKVAAFNRAFLGGVRSFGRAYEPGLLLNYNFSTGQLFKDAELGWPMLSRGKLSILPGKIRGREAIKQIFERSRQQGGE